MLEDEVLSQDSSTVFGNNSNNVSNPSRNNSNIWPSGRLLCWGSGKHGQNCQGTPDDIGFMKSLVDFFAQTSRETTVKFVACGSSHNIVVTKTNDVYVWGNNHCGQLGCGDEENRKIPFKIQLYALQRENPDIKGVACGGRHTFVWLENGNVFSFGNNSFAQLAYDFKIKNYRENQKKPHLLRNLTHRIVQQVACGEKHTVFLFKGGHVATVGNGSLGQIGNNNRNEAVTPTNIEDIPPVKFVAAGAFHTVAIDVTGEIWCWGLGSACGYNKDEGDLLRPVRYPTRQPNIVQVACGHTHNAALSANGSVYTWGYGPDGQLGLGEDVLLTSMPTKVPFDDLKLRTSHIGCGEGYTVAVTATGQLYMWGKNSHVINMDISSSVKFYTPKLLNSKDNPVDKVFCGSWHSAAITGKPKWKKEDDSSDNENDNMDIAEDEGDNDICCDMEIGALQREDTIMSRPGFSRERTSISLADFYAPSPSPTQNGKSPSPDIMLGRKKIPSYLEPRRHTYFNNKSKNQVIWKATTVQNRNQNVKLGTIEQSPNMPKKETLEMKLSRLEAASPRYGMPTVEMNVVHTLEGPNVAANNQSKEAPKGQNFSLPQLVQQHEINQGDDYLNHNTNKKSNSAPSSKDSEDAVSVTSHKTYRTHKSHVTEQLQAKMAVQPHLHEIEGKIPKSNRARQHSPLKLRTRLNNQNSAKNQPDSNAKFHKQSCKNNKYFPMPPSTINKHNFSSQRPKMFISSTRLNFLSPEPLQEQLDDNHSHSLVPKTVKRRKYRTSNSRNAISQPVELSHREGTSSVPGGFRGNGFFSRNESQLSTCSVTSPWMQPPPVNDILTRPSLRKLSNAPSIALQRLNAKKRIEKSLKERQRNVFVQPTLQGTSTIYSQHQDMDKNTKRSYALPQRVTLMAQDLINRRGNYFDNYTNQATNHHMPSINQDNHAAYDYDHKNKSQYKNRNASKGASRRVDMTVGVMNTARVT